MCLSGGHAVRCLGFCLYRGVQGGSETGLGKLTFLSHTAKINVDLGCVWWSGVGRGHVHRRCLTRSGSVMVRQAVRRRMPANGGSVSATLLSLTNGTLPSYQGRWYGTATSLRIRPPARFRVQSAKTRT